MYVSLWTQNPRLYEMVETKTEELMIRLDR
jgi:hypothetical protein